MYSLMADKGQIVLGTKSAGQAQWQDFIIDLDKVILTAGYIGSTSGTQYFIGSKRRIIVTRIGKVRN